MAKGIKRKIASALRVLDKEIAGHSARGGMYARGTATEGYDGGYRDALQDVILLLNGVQPNTRHYWSNITITNKGSANDA